MLKFVETTLMGFPVFSFSLPSAGFYQMTAPEGFSDLRWPSRTFCVKGRGQGRLGGGGLEAALPSQSSDWIPHPEVGKKTPVSQREHSQDQSITPKKTTSNSYGPPRNNMESPNLEQQAQQAQMEHKGHIGATSEETSRRHS